jgi:hypothetical protein
MFDGGIHDIIEADLQHSGAYLFRGVIERSSWQKLTFGLSKEHAESDVFKDRLLRKVEGLGGTGEIICGGLVFLYLPQGVKFDLQEQIAAITDEQR